MTLITDVRLRRVLDSRGNATVEADVTTENGGFGRAKAPEGAFARPKPPFSVVTSASTVALPRESSTRRRRTSVMSVTGAHPA